MRDLDTAHLRRMASESARRSQRQLRLMLLTIHGFVFLAALAVTAVVVFVMPWVFDALWNSIDVSLILFGLFAGWGIGLTLHGASVLVDSAWMERQLRQRAAAGALGRALLDEEAEVEAGLKRKPLTDEDPETLALSDDGELTPVEQSARDSH